MSLTNHRGTSVELKAGLIRSYLVRLNTFDTFKAVLTQRAHWRKIMYICIYVSRLKMFADSLHDFFTMDLLLGSSE